MKDLPKQFHRYFILVTVLALVLWASVVLRTEWTTALAGHLLFFAVLGVISESLPVAMPKGGYVTVSYAVFYAAVILFPAGVVLSAVAAGGLFVFRPGTPLFKRLFNAAQFVLSIAAARAVLVLSGSVNFQWSLASVFPYLMVALTYLLVNVSLASVALGLMQGKRPFALWASGIRWTTPNLLALAPLGLLMALVYNNNGPLGLLLLFIPLLLSRHSFQLYVEMRQNYLSTVEALVQALEAKDSYTSGHSERVAQLAVAMAEEMGMPGEKVEFIKYVGVLHDIGKIGVSEGILNKTGKLLEAEWEVIRNHPVTGENIIKNIKFLFDIGAVVRHHHERYDGKGYPDGLRGEEIPLEARIIAVADTYDAMTSDRSYRKGMQKHEALQELQNVAGTQLDPYLVKDFLRVLNRESFEGAGGEVEHAD
ncbi:MAG: HD-GYP domain-containing protein [Desulfitobacteriaceae bacterium]